MISIKIIIYCKSSNACIETFFCPAFLVKLTGQFSDGSELLGVTGKKWLSMSQKSIYLFLSCHSFRF